MALHNRTQYLRKEHEELLHLADRIEKILKSVPENDFARHLQNLNDLRSLEHGLAGIVEHCHAQDRLVASADFQHLNGEEGARIKAEHEQIIHAVASFQQELRFATADRTMALILPGMDVVKRLRAHIACERELLGRTPHAKNPPKDAFENQSADHTAQDKVRQYAV